jgi:hypothetical protein
MTQQANAVIYKLSEFGELSQRIAHLREYGIKAMQTYKDELAAYHRQRRGRKEVAGTSKSGNPITGFQISHMGKTLEFLRPTKPSWNAWEVYHSSAIRSLGIPGDRKEFGLLADGGKYNRPVNQNRVAAYQKLMKDGKWNDLLSDPIAITADGEVINGQHRLAAGCGLSNFGPDDRDPQFLVLFDVSRDEVAFADTSKRTGRDLTVIAQKGVQVA